MKKEDTEIAFDLHTGLVAQRVPEFDDLTLIGMAATLAIHIRGLGEIDYEVLRKVSDHYMSIPSVALERVLVVLDSIGVAQLVRSGKRIKAIIPQVPNFDDVYARVGMYAESECALNGHETAIIQILKALQNAPRQADELLQSLGIEKALFDRCLTIGSSSGIISVHQARGRRILISPFYFVDNLSHLADAAAASGASAIESVLDKVRKNQGWPLGITASTREIGGTRLSGIELSLIKKLSAEGVLRPPTIDFRNGSEAFLFTPKPGATRLNAANREIYERAMALVSTVRKGQLLAANFRVRNPLTLLRVFRDRGYIGANSEARDQYRTLVVLKVASLRAVDGLRSELHLHDIPENKMALDLAISLLETGDLADLEVNQEARIALTKDEEYIQSLVSAAEIKKRDRDIGSPEADLQFQQLILRL